MEQHRLQELIDKCLSGRATAEEQQALDDWYAAQDDNPGLDESTKAERGKEVFTNIHGRINKRSRIGRWLAAASILVLFAVGGFLLFSNKPAAPVAVWKEVQTAGEVKNWRLPDGSTVWLNAGTLIRYDSLFASREIWLQGEAFFDVAHLESKPFKVHTGTITTRVLGTAFNIDAYDTIKVFVKRGKVMVYQGKDSSGVLLPNQELVCKPDGGWSRNERTSNDNSAWTSGEFVFRDMPFSEVAGRLQRRFGVTITFKNPRIAHCSITASFEANEPLKDILEMAVLTNQSTIEQTSSGYIIDGKGCP